MSTDNYEKLLSWFIDVNRDIRQKRNLTERLREVNDLIREIEMCCEKGIMINTNQKIRDEVYYVKYRILGIS